MRNYESDGSREAFAAANDEFLRNCLKLVNYSFPWSRLSRYTLRGVAKAFYDFVSGPGGWAAWRECALAKRERMERDAEHP